MSEQPVQAPSGPKVLETRVYFEVETGTIISVHQLVIAEGEPYDTKQMQTEMREFEESLRQRHPDIDVITVDAEQIRGGEHGMKVDPATRSIVWPIDNGG